MSDTDVRVRAENIRTLYVQVGNSFAAAAVVTILYGGNDMGVHTRRHRRRVGCRATGVVTGARRGGPGVPARRTR